jgi:hypothetical protein
MTRIIVLFNLKIGATVADYEAWARRVDLPIVGALSSVERFEIFKTTGLIGSTAPTPYQYIEIIDVRDMQLFGTEVAKQTMQRVAGEFATFADALFLLTEKLE